MDILGGEKRYKPWKAPKMRKRVKTSMSSKISKNIFRMCKRLFSGFSGLFRHHHQPPSYTHPRLAVPLEQRLQPLGHYQDSNAFLSCVMKTEPGWHKTACKVVKNSADTRFSCDKDSGTVQISGIADCDLLFNKLGKSSKVRQFQFGNCSKYLFPPEVKTKDSSSQPQPSGPAPVPNPYLPNQHGYGYGYGYGYDYGNGYPGAYVEHSYPSHQYYDQEYLLPYYGY